MSKDAVLKMRRDINTYANLLNGSYVLLEKSKESEEGSFYALMGSLVLTAFSFEAYLNHLGQIKIKFWDEIERISYEKKLNVLCKELRIDPDYSKRPYQTLKELFRFRNTMAHGKSITLQINKQVSPSDSPIDHEPKAQWEEYCNEENAVRAKEDVKNIIEELNNQAKLSGYPFDLGGAVGSITS